MQSYKKVAGLLFAFNMLLKGLLQESVEGRLVHAADCACNYAAISADDVGCRNSVNAVGSSECLVVALGCGEGVALALDETSRILFVIIYAENNKMHFVFVFGVFLFNMRQLADTGRAPGSPEIDKDRLAL